MKTGSLGDVTDTPTVGVVDSSDGGDVCMGEACDVEIVGVVEEEVEGVEEGAESDRGGAGAPATAER